MSKLEPKIHQMTLMKLCQEQELDMDLEEVRGEDMEPSIAHLLLKGSLQKKIGMVLDLQLLIETVCLIHMMIGLPPLRGKIMDLLNKEIKIYVWD